LTDWGGTITGSRAVSVMTSHALGPPLAGVHGWTWPPYSSATCSRRGHEAEVSRNRSSLAGLVFPLLVGCTWPIRIRPSSRVRCWMSRIGTLCRLPVGGGLGGYGQGVSDDVRGEVGVEVGAVAHVPEGVEDLGAAADGDQSVSLGS